MAGVWEHIVEYAAAIILLVILGFLHARIDKRTKNTAKKVDHIDLAVNSRPSDQPKLYDIAATSELKIDAGNEAVARSTLDRAAQYESLARKIDRGFGEVNRRIDGVDRRLGGMDDRIQLASERITVVEDRTVGK